MDTVWGNFSATIVGGSNQVKEFYQWGGRTKGFKPEEKLSSVHRLDPSSKSWIKIECTGDLPTARYIGASASAGDCLYMYGGSDGNKYYSSLYQLSTKTWKWKQLSSSGPTRKAGCGMVAYGNKLVLFGGYGYLEGPAQPEAEYLKDTRPDHDNGVSWTDELHVFDLENGTWSSPTVSGTRPPPCAHFSFTKINDYYAVMFGGSTQSEESATKDVYMLDLKGMYWSKPDLKGNSHPMGRSRHSTVCLNYGEDHPKIFVTGGLDSNNIVLGDAWILDVHSGIWEKVDASGTVQRRHHGSAAFRLSERPTTTKVIIFGGCQTQPTSSIQHDDDLLPIADTTSFELTLTDTKWILAEKSKQCGKSTLAIPEKGHHNAVPTSLDPENRHRKVYEKVIKEKRTLNMHSVRFINIGIPRSGKTTFWRRLMKQIVNITTAQEGKQCQPSTGLAEQHRVVINSIKSILTPDDWYALNECEEAKMILQFFEESVSSKDGSSATLHPGLQTPAEISAAEQADDKAALSTTGIPSQLQSMSTAEIQGGLLPTIRPPENCNPKGRDFFFLIFEKAMKSTGKWEKLKSALEECILVDSTDTGGDAEFLGMHTALISGPSFNLLFSRLDQELGGLYQVYYTDEKGESTEEEDSDSTVEEVLLQTLSSIASFGNCHLTASEDSAVKKSLKARQSKVLFVGTYKDKVTDEDIKKRDKEVRQLIDNTELFKDVLFAGEKEPMLTVDNMNGGVDEIDKIRNILQEKIRNSFDRIPIPASWLVLSLMIRHETREQDVPTMNLEDCKEIAAKLNIDSNELQTALWFLHHGFGVLLYYPVEGLKDIVFCKIQEVFNGVTNFIKKAYTHKNVDTPSWEKFKNEGEFSLENIPNSTLDTPIGRKMLMKLLEHLNIITAISSPSPAARGPTYFMPSVLRSAKKVDDPQPNSGDPPPLILRYECGYTPMGVFPALITNLVSQSEWEIKKGELYKNRIQFHFLPESDCDTITLISHHRYFKVCISRRKRLCPHEGTTEWLCCRIRKTISSTLETITSKMNYDFKMDYKYGFKCPRCTHPESFCMLRSETATCMHCLQDPAHILDLETHHKLWFAQDTSSCDALKTANSSPQPKGCSKASTAVEISKKRKRVQELSSDEEAVPEEAERETKNKRKRMKKLVSRVHINEEGEMGLPTLSGLTQLDIIKKVSAEWRQLGVRLGQSMGDLDNYERKEMLDNIKCCMRVFDSWSNSGGTSVYPLCWKSVYDVLCAIDHQGTAEDMKSALAGRGIPME